jgi:hypothetical protein
MIYIGKAFSKTSVTAGNTNGGSITVQLTSCLTGLQIKAKIVSSHTADSKPVKQEVNGTVILPPLVFPGDSHTVPACLGHLTEGEGSVHLTFSLG